MKKCLLRFKTGEILRTFSHTLTRLMNMVGWMIFFSPWLLYYLLIFFKYFILTKAHQKLTKALKALQKLM